MNTNKFLRAGERAFNLKRLINVRRGITGKDDTLPPRFFTKMMDVDDAIQNVPANLQEHLQEYYALRGWDSDGIPTPEKLNELDFI